MGHQASVRRCTPQRVRHGAAHVGRDRVLELLQAALLHVGRSAALFKKNPLNISEHADGGCGGRAPVRRRASTRIVGDVSRFDPRICAPLLGVRRRRAPRWSQKKGGGPRSASPRDCATSATSPILCSCLPVCRHASRHVYRHSPILYSC